MKRPHILFISSWYPVRDKPTHGVFNRYFAEAVSAYCIVSVLHVASTSGDAGIEITEEPSLKTVTVYYRKVKISIPVLSHLMKFYRARHALRKGYKIIKDSIGKADLVQLNVVMPAAPLALHICRKENIPLVISENWSGYTTEDGNYRGIVIPYFTRKAIRYASRIMPTSEYLKQAMLSHGLSGNYTVVPNVVNTDVFRIQQRVASDAVRFIHISSLNDREKNVSGILRSFHAAAQQLPSIELLIVGSGVDEEKYRDLVTKLHLESKVRFTGSLRRRELVDAINQCDALVMFSNYETFCLVIPEAFACGKPVITSAAGAIPSYFRDFLGTIVPPRDERELTRALVQFASGGNQFNADKIRTYAVDNFSYGRVGRRLLNIYEEVLGE